jgi:hypothetical protein
MEYWNIGYNNKTIIPTFPPGRRPYGPEANWDQFPSFVHPEDRFGTSVKGAKLEFETYFGTVSSAGCEREMVLR